MLVPIRCFSCGKPIAQVWEEFNARLNKGEERGKVMDSLGLDRYCCRAQFLGHVDMIDDIAKFKKN